jgi:acetyltransferase
MGTRNLDAFFSPEAIALIGASRRAHSLGAVVAKNLFAGGFAGPILPVNPHEAAIGGVFAYGDIASLPVVPDLAVVAIPAGGIPAIVTELGARGCRAAVVLSAGFEGHDGGDRRDAIRIAARDAGIRLIGPNCLGVLAPGAGVNASFAHVTAPKGRIGCVMQSGALVATVLDWAASHKVGFSKLVSLGDAVDVDFGDMLNYLALDAETDAILLYIEGLTHARKFMTAARAAACIKPVIVMKAGRNPAAAAAIRSHTGAMAGADRVYDAAFRRAGIIRVDTLADMFTAFEAVVHGSRLDGQRVALITNGGGAGVLATDAMLGGSATLAALAPATTAALDAVLPPTWSGGNPVDIVGDADGPRYAAAMTAVLGDPGVDAVLVMNCPTAIASSLEAANAVVQCRSRERAGGKPVLAAWLGSAAAFAARETLSAAAIPTFQTPEEAIRGLRYLGDFQRALSHLAEVGETGGALAPVDRATAGTLLRGALQSGREWLDEADAKTLLHAYGTPVAQTLKATTPDDVAEAARAIGGAVAVKIRSQDITHKSDVAGVALNLDTPLRAHDAAARMLAHIAAIAPQARIDGFTVDAMIARPGAIELIAGVAADPTFGPVILFGHGGIAVDAMDDLALALPPLTRALADDLIGRTRVSRVLGGIRGRAPVNHAALEDALIALARLATDHPEIAELDINPLLADADGVIVLDARVRVRDPAQGAPAALQCYPAEFEHVVKLADGSEILLRPIRPEDAAPLQRYVEQLDPQTVRARFFETLRRLPPAFLARLTQIDYDCEMAFVAIDLRATPDDADPGEAVICGVGRLAVLPGGMEGEYALTACKAAIGRGVAHALMDELLGFARLKGLRRLCGNELGDSVGLIGVARERGGIVSHDRDDPTLACIALPLSPVAKAA